MKRLYIVGLLVGYSFSLVAMESKSSSELKEIVVVVPSPLAVNEFMAQLHLKDTSFDAVLASLKEMAKNSPEKYKKLVEQTKDPQMVLVEVAKYENSKRDSHIARLSTEIKSWRNLAIYGWGLAGISATAFSITALITAIYS
jgi:hypothetical protein